MFMIYVFQGFPDYHPPQHVIDKMKEIVGGDNPLSHQYTRSYVCITSSSLYLCAYHIKCICSKYCVLTLTVAKNENNQFSNSVDPDEVAHIEPPHLNFPTVCKS